MIQSKENGRDCRTGNVFLSRGRRESIVRHPMGQDDGAAMLMSCMMLCMTLCMCSSSSSSVTSMMTGKQGAANTKTTNPHMERNASAGLWESPSYGGGGGKSTRAMCPPNSYLTSVIGFHGEGMHTNALQGYCYDPDTHDVKRLFPGVTCGNRDKPSVGAAFEFIGYMLATITLSLFTVWGVAFLWMGPIMIGKTIGWSDARKNVLKPQFGRKLWKYKFMSAPAGVYAWDILSKDSEVNGVNFYGLNGETSGWIGGREGGYRVGPDGPRRQIDPVIKGATSGRCPLGKVVVGIDAGCGDRVDRLKFLCDIPRHK